MSCDDQKLVTDDPIALDVDSEAIMGQYIYAVGCGANGQWVQRSAITYLRDYYLKTILSALEFRCIEGDKECEETDWHQDAPKILHYMQVIGRLAAQKATTAGRDSIERSDMEEAVIAVEGNYKNAVKGMTPPVTEGRWCP